MKATMMGAGDSIYPDWKPFSRDEIRKHLGLYIFNGVAPSPQIAFRSQSQIQDPIYGNDMIREAFGTNAKSRHRQFKCFFALQNPCIPTPSRKTFPNWKVRPLLKWINHVRPQCYTPGKSISVFCRACNVNLCVSCYRLFHTESDIVGQKKELQQRLKPKNANTNNKV